ncbi:hypothetical protein GYO_2210 [Bacillus spizizenii TU-B-10]|uniref:Uncharacterized protein n=1 Tax=Bacillus spizizenii (strain DSM 15029 / JCM 12233 / NBRC 101239 / NRRL B-23049 / TU-B-10) TaxID=1052585 RepID=G4NWX3_BACS4|nr:hypothetical protein GYO_2210 [Bacillus spizizenii TU-B-10]SCV41489.1 hypothetical protein BQ1740_2518 [Bacillus subtilis]
MIYSIHIPLDIIKKPLKTKSDDSVFLMFLKGYTKKDTI